MRSRCMIYCDGHAINLRFPGDRYFLAQYQNILSIISLGNPQFMLTYIEKKIIRTPAKKHTMIYLQIISVILIQ